MSQMQQKMMSKIPQSEFSDAEYKELCGVNGYEWKKIGPIITTCTDINNAQERIDFITENGGKVDCIIKKHPLMEQIFNQGFLQNDRNSMSKLCQLGMAFEQAKDNRDNPPRTIAFHNHITTNSNNTNSAINSNNNTAIVLQEKISKPANLHLPNLNSNFAKSSPANLIKPAHSLDSSTHTNSKERAEVIESRQKYVDSISHTDNIHGFVNIKKIILLKIAIQKSMFILIIK